MPTARGFNWSVPRMRRWGNVVYRDAAAAGAIAVNERSPIIPSLQ